MGQTSQGGGQWSHGTWRRPYMGMRRYDEDGIDQVKEECQGVMALMEVEHVSTSVSHTLWGVQDGLLICSSKLGMDGLVVWASNRGLRR